MKELPKIRVTKHSDGGPLEDFRKPAESNKIKRYRKGYQPVEQQFINILKKVKSIKEKNTLKKYGFEMVFYLIKKSKVEIVDEVFLPLVLKW
ncbi:hypothetical protein ABEW32_06315 [Paenibacillus jamilae]|uniref:hypothetical protein n=1 Tax=Paenibacillus jamilae TaxID=114136 RepID=UPI003D271DF2